MISVSEVVQQILRNDPVAFEAMRSGFLNLSAYAEQIHDFVEDKTFKLVKKTTIVTALARMMPKIQAESALIPKIRLNDVIIKSPLTDITFEKNNETLEKLSSLRKKLEQGRDFLTITQGSTEITMIVPASRRDEIVNHFAIKPKALINDLVCVSVSFSEQYIPTPNVIYTLIRALAIKKINVLEIVSTYTELSVVIAQPELHGAIEAFESFLEQ